MYQIVTLIPAFFSKKYGHLPAKLDELNVEVWILDLIIINHVEYHDVYNRIYESCWWWCRRWLLLYSAGVALKWMNSISTEYPKKYAHGFCFAVLCCRYTLTDFPISIRLTSLALWQSYDRPSASKATLMNMDKYFMWIHYERLRNHNKAKHNKTVCIFLGIFCIKMTALP